MTTVLESITNDGRNIANHEAPVGAEAHFFNDALLTPIQKAGSENNDTSTSGFENLFNTGESTSIPPAECTWSVDQENKTIYLDNGYKIVIEGTQQAWQIIDAEGNVSRIWGDPHVHEGDGGKWDFKADMTFELEDGTKITVQTKDWGNGMSVSDNLIITNGDNCVQVTGLADNQPHITEVTSNGVEIDANTNDGYVATEMEGTDDWSLNDEEIIRDLPFVDAPTYHDGMIFYEGDLFNVDLIDLESVYTEEVVNQHFDDLEAELMEKLEAYRQDLANADRYHDVNFYLDLTLALEGDIQALNDNRNTGTLEQRAQFFNNLHTEASTELKYNINLTNALEPAWSIEELEDLQTELERMPIDFSVFNPKLSRIGIADLPDGVAARNRDGNGIDIDPNYINWALIHEIGHYYDQSHENLRMDQFMEISGWRDVTSDFSSISSDYVDGSYRPYDGTAVLNRDGQVYNDGDAVDLDGDGIDDGIVQVNYGDVMIYDPSATFARSYGSTHFMEDFATTFEYFFKNPASLQRNAPEKYDFMVAYTGVDPLADAVSAFKTDTPVWEMVDDNLFDIVS